MDDDSSCFNGSVRLLNSMPHVDTVIVEWGEPNSDGAGRQHDKLHVSVWIVVMCSHIDLWLRGLSGLEGMSGGIRIR